jgi:hypothetical protein
MTDLPPASVACALELVGAVRDYDQAKVAHTLRTAANLDGLEALAVTLAAMVDDERTLTELLAWCSPSRDDDVRAWRRALTDEQCRDYRNAYLGGDRCEETVDGKREWERRATAKQRKRVGRQLRAAS